MSFSQVCDFSHLQLMTPRELRQELRMQGFEVLHVESLSELSYAGAVYAKRLTPSERLAGWVGSAFEWRPFRRIVLGHNKTFVVARPRPGIGTSQPSEHRPTGGGTSDPVSGSSTGVSLRTVEEVA